MDITKFARKTGVFNRIGTIFSRLTSEAARKRDAQEAADKVAALMRYEADIAYRNGVIDGTKRSLLEADAIRWQTNPPPLALFTDRINTGLFKNSPAGDATRATDFNYPFRVFGFVKEFSTPNYGITPLAPLFGTRFYRVPMDPNKAGTVFKINDAGVVSPDSVRNSYLDYELIRRTLVGMGVDYFKQGGDLVKHYTNHARFFQRRSAGDAPQNLENTLLKFRDEVSGGFMGDINRVIQAGWVWRDAVSKYPLGMLAPFYTRSITWPYGMMPRLVRPVVVATSLLSYTANHGYWGNQDAPVLTQTLALPLTASFEGIRSAFCPPGGVHPIVGVPVAATKGLFTPITAGWGSLSTFLSVPWNLFRGKENNQQPILTSDGTNFCPGVTYGGFTWGDQTVTAAQQPKIQLTGDPAKDLAAAELARDYNTARRILEKNAAIFPDAKKRYDAINLSEAQDRLKQAQRSGNLDEIKNVILENREVLPNSQALLNEVTRQQDVKRVVDAKTNFEKELRDALTKGQTAKAHELLNQRAMLLDGQINPNTGRSLNRDPSAARDLNRAVRSKDGDPIEAIVRAATNGRLDKQDLDTAIGLRNAVETEVQPPQQKQQQPQQQKQQPPSMLRIQPKENRPLNFSQLNAPGEFKSNTAAVNVIANAALNATPAAVTAAAPKKDEANPERPNGVQAAATKPIELTKA